MKTKIFIVMGIVTLHLLCGCSDKIEERQYDFSFKKSINQYGVTFYNFKHLKAPPVALLPNKKGISNTIQVNEVLKSIGEPLLNNAEHYRSPGKKLFVWDNYKKGKLVVSLRECKYDVDDKKNYTCIKRLYIEPSNKKKMINQAMKSNTRIFVSKDKYGDQWPFTVDFGILACRRWNAVIFRTEDHQVYALNGKAIAMKKYKDVRQIWKDNPNIPGAKVSLSRLIQEVLELCE